jgi:hypothetical protein
MHSQRYVSKELTHFTGRNCRKPDGTHDQEPQYALLVKILRAERLLPRSDCVGGSARITFRGDGSFEMRTMIDVDAVYFCDIPVADFGIHTHKYSAFGLSFLKSFLVGKGANPAFYIAKDSIISPEDPAATTMFADSARPNPLTRGVLMDQLIKTHLGTPARLRNMTLIERSRSNRMQAKIARTGIIDSMIRSHFLSFCVPFDSAKDDTDQENYYMEREWRVIGDVRFSLDDVYRVILPRPYAQRLRDDVSDYVGQITFPDY